MEQKHFFTEVFKEQNFKKEEFELMLLQYHKVEFAMNDFLIQVVQVGNFYYFLERGFARSDSNDLKGVDVSNTIYID